MFKQDVAILNLKISHFNLKEENVFSPWMLLPSRVSPLVCSSVDRMNIDANLDLEIFSNELTRFLKGGIGKVKKACPCFLLLPKKILSIAQLILTTVH